MFNQTEDIKLCGLNGTIKASIHTGILSVEDSQTPLIVAENESGEVFFWAVSGTQNVRSNTGSIKVLRSFGKVLSDETVAGVIDIDFDEPVKGSHNVRTVK